MDVTSHWLPHLELVEFPKHMMPSGKQNKKLLKMAIEIVDLPINGMVIFQVVM